MKRKQHRFETEQEILDRIDSIKEKLASPRDTTEELRKIDAKCRRIEDSTLPHLKNALAAFRTEVLEFSKHDKAVVLQ